ncbi:S-formylglutathione hydrolase [Thraustotheca clavata]|uniref:S-formylglutathione hydrolase n=1 Tax=Thraustotheca clavata TaxID=74557 RepID=A0A1V9YBW5_9STRA|nr:S-formylglutathione hydrolase [Thraustotheca clavata]
MAVRLLKQSKSFGGVLQHYAHESTATNSSMRFSVYLPPTANLNHKVPAIYFLAGATRNEETFLSFGGAQRFAAARGVALVAPDTSPRISQGSSHWAYGPGASWYVDATQPRWTKHYNMQSYVSKELPALIQIHFPILPTKQSIMGHSMGGHGALITALRNPDLFESVSAFAPACNPTHGEYGAKAFKNYLGADHATW